MTVRENQKQRTREALFEAALQLSRQGRQTATIAEVADAARVSTATAYRYFPNPQALWADLAVWQAPRLVEVLRALPDSGTVEDRLDAVIRAAATLQFADEALWRAVLRATLDRWFHQAAEFSSADGEPVPIRSSTRLDTTREILAPLADRLDADQFERLTRAVVLVYGVEAMVVSRDALDLDLEQAADVMSWAAAALVRAAIAEAAESATTPQA